jgi:hypothetical protein
VNPRTETPNEVRASEIVFARLLNAPRGHLLRAWTDPKHLARWWGPWKFTNPACELDPRPGGPYRIAMRGPGAAADRASPGSAPNGPGQHPTPPGGRSRRSGPGARR